VEKVLETAATEDLWSRALDRIKGKLPDSSFEMWFSEVRARGTESGGLELVLPSDYIRSWLASHYAELIADAVTGAAGQPVPIRFATEHRGLDRPGAPPAGVLPPPAASLPTEPEGRTSPFPPKYTFETFVRGDSNRFAYAAAMAVAEAPPSKAYNPLFIYGGVGIVKTHLLFGVANHRS
jgi:chromosomal replication initiator protein